MGRRRVGPAGVAGWIWSLLRYAVRINGLTSLAITKLDVLDGCKELKICTGYRYQGKLHKEMPGDLQVLTGCEPVYERWRGLDNRHHRSEVHRGCHLR